MWRYPFVLLDHQSSKYVNFGELSFTLRLWRFALVISSPLDKDFNLPLIFVTSKSCLLYDLLFLDSAFSFTKSLEQRSDSNLYALFRTDQYDASTSLKGVTYNEKENTPQSAVKFKALAGDPTLPSQHGVENSLMVTRLRQKRKTRWDHSLSNKTLQKTTCARLGFKSKSLLFSIFNARNSSFVKLMF